MHWPFAHAPCMCLCAIQLLAQDVVLVVQWLSELTRILELLGSFPSALKLFK